LSIIKKTNNLTIYGSFIQVKFKFQYIYLLFLFLLKGLEYSEHSSFEELKNCVKSLKPRKVIPTVNIATQIKREKMQNFLNEWMTK